MPTFGVNIRRSKGAVDPIFLTVPLYSVTQITITCVRRYGTNPTQQAYRELHWGGWGGNRGTRSLAISFFLLRKKRWFVWISVFSVIPFVEKCLVTFEKFSGWRIIGCGIGIGENSVREAERREGFPHSHAALVNGIERIEQKNTKTIGESRDPIRRSATIVQNAQSFVFFL